MHSIGKKMDDDPLRNGSIFRVTDLSRLRSTERRSPQRKVVEPRTLTEAESREIKLDFEKFLNNTTLAGAPVVRKKRRKRRSDEVAPHTPPKATDQEVTRTRSGRRSCRVLEWWKNERMLVRADGETSIVVQPAQTYSE